MPAADTVLLPLCVGLALLGVIITGIAWHRGNRGRVIQGVGLALAPIGLYLSGLLRLVWDGVVAVVGWAGRIVFSPTLWLGLSLLALCLVLWVVGGFAARRSGARKTKKRDNATAPAAVTAKSAGSGRTPAKASPQARQADPIDDDMAEIEALLKSRGIE